MDEYEVELAYRHKRTRDCSVRSGCVWAAGLAAALHSACIALLLLQDEAQPAFWALLNASAVEDSARTIVLMHHKRTDELNATLHGLAALRSGGSLRVIVTQALQPDEAPAAAATAALLRRLGGLRLTLVHSVSLLPMSEVDTSYSVDAKRFGTKKNSLRNMLHGLRRAFGHDEAALARETVRFDRPSAHPPRPPTRPPASVIVMEDDVAVSPDLLDYFEFASSLLHAARAAPAPHRPVLASSFCILRRPNPDFGYAWLPSRLLLRHLEPRPDRYRFAPLSFTTFKTFAWLLPRATWALLDSDFTSMLALPSNATALHPSLRGCPYCSNFCYDHYLEWRHRHSAVVCPDYPRSRQMQLGVGGGMTEKPGEHLRDRHAMERAGRLLNTRVVRAWQFVEGAHRRRAVRLLDALCAWGGPVALLWLWSRAGSTSAPDKKQRLRA
jgi:hypothetical protein